MATVSGRCSVTERPFVLVRLSAGVRQPGESGRNVLGLALLDTGAEVSAISVGSAEHLALTTRSTKPVEWSGSEWDAPLYKLKIGLVTGPSEAMLGNAIEMVEVTFRGAPQLTGFEVVAILGIDVIAKFRFNIDGPANIFEFVV